MRVLKFLAVGILGAGILGAGCGSAPPPKPPPPKPLLSSLAPATPTPVSAAKPTKRLMVLSTGAMPAEEPFENAVARTSINAEVGERAFGFDVAAAGVFCTVKKTELPADRPDPGIFPELAAHGLSPEEGAALKAATAALLIECQPEGGGMTRAMGPVVEAVADALVRLQSGHLHDPQTGRYWPSAEWSASRKANRRFAIERSVRVIRYSPPDGTGTWLGTRGMAAFGRPDLEIFPVPRDAADALARQLQVVADAVIADAPAGQGTTLSLGPVTVLMVDRDAYAGVLPTGAAGTTYTPTGETRGRVALVPGDARTGDTKAFGAFLQRLVRR
jgi:hypothetical protein